MESDNEVTGEVFAKKQTKQQKIYVRPKNKEQKKLPPRNSKGLNVGRFFYVFSQFFGGKKFEKKIQIFFRYRTPNDSSHIKRLFISFFDQFSCRFEFFRLKKNKKI
jgi:hypothetical protein